MGVFRHLKEHGGTKIEQLADSLGAEECLLGKPIYDLKAERLTYLIYIKCEFYVLSLQRAFW